MKLLLHKRGSVALLTAIMAPVLIMTLALGVEVSSWSLKKVELQRIADVAAWAGARQYVATTNAQSAANTAADLAEVNGATGGTRSWISPTLTDNSITAQVVVSGAGVKTAADPIVKVTVKQSINKSFSGIFPSTQSSVTVSAVAVAEIVSSIAGSQPCLLALNGDGSGVLTDPDLEISGSATITTSGCSIRSDGDINISGSVDLTVAAAYAAGVITHTGSSSINNGDTSELFPNDGQIPDPYAQYAPITSAFSSLSSGGLPDPNIGGSGPKPPINPGTYSSLSVSGSVTVTLNPGLYIVNGPVSFSGSTQVTGIGVTIVSSGALSISGSVTGSLAAPQSNSTLGIPGILFAGNSTASSSLSGSASLPLAGVIYYPKGTMAFSGSASNGSSGCTEVIADTITISGSVSLAANCTSYGTLKFGSSPSSSSIALVQ